MAEHKKAFILYTDLIDTVDCLSDEQAGALFKLILAYTNDLDPEVGDSLLKIIFAPIRAQLKRDLEKWRERRQMYVEKGRKGGVASAKKRSGQVKIKQAQVSPAKHNSANPSQSNPVSVSVSVSASVSVIPLEKEKEDLLSEWIAYRRSIGKRIKNKKTIENLRKKLSETSLEHIEFTFRHSIDNEYQGLFWNRRQDAGTQQSGTSQDNLRDLIMNK